MKVVLYDDSILDAHSKRILVSGIDTRRFLKNPVLLYVHDSYQMPVGKVKSVSIEGARLTGEIEFDEDDSFAQELKRKYEKGYLNGFSIGVRSIEESMESTFLLDSQQYATITKSELFELSCVPIPSNENALVIRNAQIIERFYQKHNFMLEKIIRAFGLQEGITEEEAISQIKRLFDKAQENASESAYKVAKRFGAFENEAEETAFRTLAKNDLDSALVFLKKAQEQPATEKEKRDATADTFASFAELLKRATAGAGEAKTEWERKKEERAGLSYLEWAKKHPQDLAYAKENDATFFDALKTKRTR